MINGKILYLVLGVCGIILTYFIRDSVQGDLFLTITVTMGCIAGCIAIAWALRKAYQILQRGVYWVSEKLSEVKYSIKEKVESI